jgi:hypothetical protein
VVDSERTNLASVVKNLPAVLADSSFMGVDLDPLVRRDILTIWQIHDIDAYSAHGTNLKMSVMLDKEEGTCKVQR